MYLCTKNFISKQKKKTNIPICSYESYNFNTSQCETAPENPSQAVFLSYQQGAVNIPLSEVKISVNRADRPMIEPWKREGGPQIDNYHSFCDQGICHKSTDFPLICHHPKTIASGYQYTRDDENILSRYSFYDLIDLPKVDFMKDL